MDFNLNDEQRAYQQSAALFAEKELSPNAAQWDEESFFPVDVIKRAGQTGFCSLYTPAEIGGMGLSRLDSCLIIEELAKGCTSTTAYLTIHNMATWMIASFGSETLQQAWCPKLVNGDLLASYCLTEPNAGSDAASLKTTAKRDGDDYIINGSKMFISGAGDTDVLVLMARTGEPGAKGISSFVVPANLEGISYGRKESKMGWNSQPTRAITLQDVKVPAGNLIGQEGEGFKIAMKGLDGGRINIATCSLGTAQAALEQAQRYLNERKQFGRTLASFQALQFKLADMATELIAARQMVHLAAWKLDHKDPEATVYSAMAKRFATDVCFNICNEALQIHGGYGYIREYPLERHVRDSRVHQILEGTNEIMRVIIARRLLMEGATDIIR
ncbi:acyl-CoA dehydrogenase family protein [Alkalimarinus sediminis]|uniref:Acyl-CoA dehydrogenase family protein n=1 Tax=Alkalimarinus sediminis TaxID=1632866 RepID=A0A9E8KNL6_9ALTE|nr:acyl-CoA dehydrogenase family protein [Alkalimarinus sediminis]UZW74483.1 acyl-CoA dehydrogenase family protein [Alkalimarinus sediminis]